MILPVGCKGIEKDIDSEQELYNKRCVWCIDCPGIFNSSACRSARRTYPLSLIFTTR